MPVNDTDLITKPWDMSITHDSDGKSKAFQIAITSVKNGQIVGKIIPNGPDLSGQFRRLGPKTGQSIMGLKLNIDGVQIFLSGPVTKPGADVLFDGSYNRLGLVGPTALFDDPGETGTGAGQQTT